ncbi:MAG TPA: PIN domain-containing protein [bacterium]|nr:PIN domain-containing protein [bacterium]
MQTTHEKTQLLLVDFENVQQVELANLDDSYRVIIFVGADQKSVPFDLVTRAQQLGGRVEWQKITGNGSNALDFFIAFQLGRAYDQTPKPECLVLSRDKGFDPLIKYLNANGMKSRRIGNLNELHHKAAAAAPAPAAEDARLQRVIHVLGKVEKRARPRKRKTLSQAISAMFQKKISRQEIDHIIGTMQTKGMISETNNTITYEF